MKKFVYIVTACLSFFVFYLSFSMYSEAEGTGMTMNFVSKIKNDYNYNFNVYQVKFTKDISKNISELETFADEYQAILMMGIDQLSDSESITSWFLYDSNHVLSFVTKKQKPFSFSEASSKYLTTNETDQNSYDIIDFVDPRNNKEYQDTIRLYPLSAYETVSEKQRLNLYIYSNKDKDTMDELIHHSNIAKYIEAPIVLNTTSMKTTDYTTVYQIMIVCAISICLLLICLSLKSQKEIILRKLVGMSNLTIARNLFLQIVGITFSVYCAIQFLCCAIWVKGVRVIAYPFFMILAKYAVSFGLFLIIVYGILYAYVRTNGNFMTLKQSNFTNKAIWVNRSVKFLVLLIVLPTLIFFVKQGHTAVSEYFYIVSHKTQMKNQVYIISVDDRQANDKGFTDPNKLIQKMNQYMVQQGAVYQDFETYAGIENIRQQHPEDSDFASISPYIIVNAAYLKDYVLHDTNGKQIAVQNLKRETIFIPENQAFMEEDKWNYCENECDVVYVKKGNTYWNQHIRSSIRKLKDPYVIYKPETINSYGDKSYHLIVDTLEKKQRLQNFADKEGFSEILSMKDTSNDYEVMREKYKDDIIFLFPLFVTYIFVIMIFIYQDTYIYFMRNKREFAIKYLSGAFYLERHENMIFHNVLVYVPILFLLYFVFSVSWQDAVCCIALAVIFELSGSYMLIRRFEKNRMIEILKGE